MNDIVNKSTVLEMKCHVLNKMSLDPIPDWRWVKRFKKIRKNISKRIILKKIAIIRGKEEFTNIKGSICNILYEDISISVGLSSKKIINLSGTHEHQDVAESIHKKVISDETEYSSVEDPLSMDRTGSNETAHVSKIPCMINDENIITAPGQAKNKFKM